MASFKSMELVPLAIGVLRRDGPVVFASKVAKFAGRKAAVPVRVAKDFGRNTWPKASSLPQADPVREPRPWFLVDPVRLGELTDEFRSVYPEAAKNLIAQADEFLHDRYDILGSGPVTLGPKIDWNLDFVHNFRFPRRHYLRQPYVFDDPSDVKVPWEFARLQHLPVLALAYRLTGDEKYARKIVDQIVDFCDHNPPRYGIHWFCAMEVGLRVFSVALAVTWISDWMRGRSREWATVFRMAQASGEFIMGNLEYSDYLTSNHYLSDLLGLAAIGAAFPELPDAGEWLRFGGEEFKKEIEKQFYEEGANFESSIPYHRLSLELVATRYLLGRRHGIDFGDAYKDR
ncbi:hypothetical protein KDL45_02945, partial [bacterium]|nr:hypothetical protein [bacterium]